MKTTRLRVALCAVVPEVVRVVDVPASSTLPELHDLLQAALGWTDSHLHQFVAGETVFGVPDPDGFLEEQDEAAARLRDLPDRFGYLYDFGDGWEHEVEVLGAGGDRPGCVYGEGACPPEDCGGPGGYTELLMVLADPAHEEHAQMREWAGELPQFDQAATDRLVRQVVGEVPASVRLVLELAEPGVKLTPGGRLPRTFVRLVQEQRPHWHLLGRPASIEDDLLPLAALHEVLSKVGLLRRSRGLLRPTKAARDDLEVVRRLRSWFEPESFTTILAGLTIAVLETNGPMPGERLAATVLPLLGRGWTSAGQPLTSDDVRISIAQISSVLHGLDQVEIDWPVWRSGASARCLIPRATALSALWSTHPMA